MFGMTTDGIGTVLPEDQDQISKGKQSLRKAGNLRAPAGPDADGGGRSRLGRPGGLAPPGMSAGSWEDPVQTLAARSQRDPPLSTYQVSASCDLSSQPPEEERPLPSFTHVLSAPRLSMLSGLGRDSHPVAHTPPLHWAADHAHCYSDPDIEPRASRDAQLASWVSRHLDFFLIGNTEVTAICFSHLQISLGSLF